MFPHRATILALAVLFAAGFSSAASACCGWSAPTPTVYAPPATDTGFGGCGGCRTPTAATFYAQPVAPTPRPVVRTWTGRCGCACGCRGFVYAAVPAIESYPIAPAPIYVVNQGPDFTGPGIMVPFHTWTPSQSYVVPGAYPHMHGYRFWHRHGYGYEAQHRTATAPHAHLAYHGRFEGHHQPMPVPRSGKKNTP